MLKRQENCKALTSEGISDTKKKLPIVMDGAGVEISLAHFHTIRLRVTYPKETSP
jgi:hypothetical protein